MIELSGEERYRRYAALRKASPCHWDEDRRRWLLTRYSDVYGVLKDHEAFSSARTISVAQQDGAGSASILMSDDPPRHTKIRSIVARSFTTKSLESLRPWIEDTTHALLYSIKSGSIEVIGAFAEPLSVMTIACLLGLDTKQWKTLKRWSSAILGCNDPREKQARLRDAVTAHKYFSREIQRRKRYPLNDLISRIIQCDDGHPALSPVEAQAYCVLLLVAGNETTISLLGNALNVLCEQPSIWQQLREGRIPTSSVIDETLRFDSPVQIIRRVVKKTIRVNDSLFQAGETIEACLGAANRDPAEFACPDVFDPTRDLRRHLAFGHGIHYCLGASLARMLAEVALTQCFERFVRITRVSSGARTKADTLSAFASLPIFASEN